MNKPEQAKRAKLLGAAISQLLKEKDLKQRQLAEKIANLNDREMTDATYVNKTDATYVNKLVKGKIARPRPKIYDQILKALEVTEEELEKRISYFAEQEKAITQPIQDWGEAPKLPEDFSGRTKELTELEQWIVTDQYRLVALLGAQGIGKTTLGVRLTERIKDKFDYFIWRSLRNAPPANALLSDLLKFFNNQQKVNLPEAIDEKITLLIDFLKRKKCLLVLDDLEAICQKVDQVYQYRKGYKEYGNLIMQVGQKLHQSCVVLIGRELIHSLEWLNYEKLPVIYCQLKSLKEEEERKILKGLDCSTTSESDWSNLMVYCSSNLLLLKIIGKVIYDKYEGNISEFLTNNFMYRTSLKKFGDYLEKYIELTDLEKTIMYWLAIERKPVNYEELAKDCFPAEVEKRIRNSLDSLKKRALVEIEKKSSAYTQQTEVMDYMTCQLVEQVCEEILTENIEILNKYSLAKATAECYIRSEQSRFILKPIIDKLKKELKSIKAVEDRLTNIISKRQVKSPCHDEYLGGNIINLLLQMQPENKDLSNHNFSNLTIRQANLENVKLRKVDFTNSIFKDTIFSKTLTCILSIAFSTDGKKFAISEANGNIKLWSTTTDREPLTFQREHPSAIWSIDISPTEAKLASGGQDGTVRLWDTGTGHCFKKLDDHNGCCVHSVAFSPDGQTLVSGSDDRSIIIWNVEASQRINTLQLGTAVYSVAIASDGVTLASGGEDGTVRLWNINTGELLQTLHKHKKTVYCVAFSSDGATLASSGEDETVTLWDIATGVPLQTLQGGMNQVRTLAFSPDGKTLATGSDDRVVRVWNVSTGQCQSIFSGHTNRLRAVAFSPDGETLISGGDDRTFRLWDVTVEQCREVRQGESTNRIWSVAFSSDGKTLASGSEDKMIRLWDVDQKTCCILRGHSDWVWSVAFSPNGKVLASGSEDKTVRLWDVNTGKILREFSGHTSRVRLVAFDKDGKYVASASNDRAVRVWDLENAECWKILEGHDQRVLSVAFSPKEKMLASGSRDHTVRLWDISTGKDKILLGHTNQVHSVAFSPNSGEILASCSYDKTIKLWEVSTGRTQNTLLGHTDQILSIAFSPDGKTLASGSHDRTVRLWDIDTGKCLHCLTEHKGAVESVTFSPNGQTVASGSQDEKIILWNVKTGEECSNSPLKDDRVYEGMIIQGVKDLNEATIAMLEDLGAVGFGKN